jgi:hypothetical protein
MQHMSHLQKFYRDIGLSLCAPSASMFSGPSAPTPPLLRRFGCAARCEERTAMRCSRTMGKQANGARPDVGALV